MANDTISWPSELPYITDQSDYLGATTPGIHASILHNGLVVALIAEGEDLGPDIVNYDYKIWRWNGTSWDNLDFPTTLSFADSSLGQPQARTSILSLASDGTTLWFAFVVDETVDYGTYLRFDLGPGNTWTAGSSYVWAFDESGGWTNLYYRLPATHNGGGVALPAVGEITQRLASHDGAGYCWLVSNEVGARGGSSGDPYTISLVIAEKLDANGPLEGNYGLNYGGSVFPGTGEPIDLYSGTYYGPDLADDGTVGDLFLNRVDALATDGGFPMFVSTLFSGQPGQLLDGIEEPAGSGTILIPPRSAIRADTLEQLQATNDFGTPLDGQYVRDGFLYLATEITTDDGADDPLFYPEEVYDPPDFNGDRIQIYKIPVDASDGFTPLEDSTGEDVSLAKNPLEASGPETEGNRVSALAGLTSTGNVYIMVKLESSVGDGLIVPFIFKGGCPLPIGEHGRYAWEWAYDDEGFLIVAAPYSPSGPGVVGSPHADWFPDGLEAVLDEAAERIYVIAWAMAGDGTTYLRCWYFPLCIGCDKCVSGLHVWQTI